MDKLAEHCLTLTQDRRPGTPSSNTPGLPGHRLPSQSLAARRRGTSGSEPWPVTSWQRSLSSKAQPAGKCCSGILPQLPGRISVVAKAVDPAGKGASVGFGTRPRAVALAGRQAISCSPEPVR